MIDNFIEISLLQLCGGDAPYINPRELENRSEIYRNKALTLFNATRKMGGPEISKEFEEMLNKDIDESYVKKLLGYFKRRGA